MTEVYESDNKPTREKKFIKAWPSQLFHVFHVWTFNTSRSKRFEKVEENLHLQVGGLKTLNHDGRSHMAIPIDFRAPHQFPTKNLRRFSREFIIDNCRAIEKFEDPTMKLRCLSEEMDNSVVSMEINAIVYRTNENHNLKVFDMKMIFL